MCQEAQNAKKKILEINNHAIGLSNFICDWIATHQNSKFLNCQYNKDGDLYAAVLSNDNIYLFSQFNQSIMYAPRLTFSTISKAQLHIDDIVARNNNVGNGSILMTAFLQYAWDNGAQIITGTISSIDYDHLDRLTHFYQKFGFHITKNSIRKEMLH